MNWRGFLWALTALASHWRRQRDDEPAPPQNVITEACRLLGVDPPPETPFEEAELSDMARSFYRDNKRVSNERIKNELGVVLTWPNYREGLKGLISGTA